MSMFYFKILCDGLLEKQVDLLEIVSLYHLAVLYSDFNISFTHIDQTWIIMWNNSITHVYLS